MGVLRCFGVAGVSFEVDVPRGLMAAFSNELPDGWPAEGAPAQGVRLREGRPSLRWDGSSLEVTSFRSDLGPALRGVFTVALDQREGALLHGAGLVLDGRGILCIAPSEGGKTTLCGKLAGRVPVLSDETIALRMDDAHPRLGGTFFWSGPVLPSAPGLFPLGAVCFLRKGAMEIRSLPRAQAVQELLSEWHLPERPGAALAALERADRLLRLIPSFELSTTLEGDPLPLLHEILARSENTDAE